jgi:hypothetical protein
LTRLFQKAAQKATSKNGIAVTARMQDFQALLEKIRETRAGEIPGTNPKKMGAGDGKVRDQKPRPQICVVSKVTFDQDR